MLPSLHRAISYLISARNAAGLWSDFLLPTGESDGWVTGYVGSVLAASDDARARAAARETWEVFGPSHFFDGHGGWSFNVHSPEDADSTAWGIRYALALGLAGKLRVTAAERFLRGHLTSEGGIATFVDARELARFLGAPVRGEACAWMATHPCVTAAAACLPDLNAALTPYLRASQTADGDWPAFWWRDTQYTTALAVEALSMHDAIAHRGAIDNAVRWVVESFRAGDHVATAAFPEGSPFATALAVRTLALAGSGHRALIASARDWLVGRQRTDGSWEPSALLLVPPAASADSGDPELWSRGVGARWGTFSLDRHAIFTTATVLAALAAPDSSH